MSSSGIKYTLQSSDGKIFEVDEAMALESRTIKRLIEDGRGDRIIHLPAICSSDLSKVTEYCNKHIEAAKSNLPRKELKAWDAEFVKVDSGTLFNLAMAAHRLKIKKLLDLTLKTMLFEIKRKGPDDATRQFIERMESWGLRFDV